MNRPYSRKALLGAFQATGAARKGGQWTLASGKQSDFYVDVRKVVAEPTGAMLIADGILGPVLHLASQAALHQSGPVYVVSGGVGGTSILGALMAWAGVQGVVQLRAVVVRDQAKDHGTGLQVEGLPADGPKGLAIVIDDVLTTGGSVTNFINAVKDRLDVQAVAVVVDREEGGAEELAKLPGLHFNYLLRRADLEPIAIQEVKPTPPPTPTPPAPQHQEESHERQESDEDAAEREARVEQANESRDAAEADDRSGDGEHGR